MWCDNQAAIAIAANAGNHQRTKHIDVRLHHLRQHLSRNMYRLQWIPTAEQLADVLTKHVQPHAQFNMLVSQLLCTTPLSQ